MYKNQIKVIKMGNEQSLSSAIEIHQKALEVTDFYSHHTATINFGNMNKLSVFVSEPIVDGTVWKNQTPLEKSSKNLMVYRHPCILKYVSSWEKGSVYQLAVEEVKPLSQVIASLNNLQICVGLHSILKALAFLHEMAKASHNNVCLAAIYITKDGNWKLGGMEYLCKFSELSVDYLSKTRNYRYNKAVDPNESKYLNDKTKRLDFIDLYGFSILVNDVIKKKSDDIPFLTEFLDFCRSDLQNIVVNNRPKITSLLAHDFFNHDFIKIHCFLTELALKSDVEKNEFFTTLMEKLKKYDEVVVANQLTNLLLSRMVLLDKTAQTKLLPFVLCPRESDSENNTGLFSVDTFKKYLVPKLLEIFCVRDAQIRLLLLDNLVHYLSCFEIQDLQTHILPELLVGIKDTNDHLVAVTLRALADLIPILGSSTVIGGKRAKLFNDGRPIVHSTKQTRKLSRKITDLSSGSTSAVSILSSSVVHTGSDILETSDLPERPSPDGEEGEESSIEDLEQEPEEENWEDWEVNEENRETAGNLNGDITEMKFDMAASISSSRSLHAKKSLPDIMELDIKNQKGSGDADDIDFFQDMEPVIETVKYPIVAKVENIEVDKKFGVVSEDHEEGWGDEEW